MTTKQLFIIILKVEVSIHLLHNYYSIRRLTIIGLDQSWCDVVSTVLISGVIDRICQYRYIGMYIC